MRFAALFALLLPFASLAANAQDASPLVERAQVVAACASQVVLPAGRTANEATITSYCECVVSRAEVMLTPAEFVVFGRVGLSRAGIGSMPTQEELRAVEGEEFRRKGQLLVSTMQTECNPILFN